MCRRGKAVHRDLQIIARDIHLQYTRFEIAFAIEGLQHFLIVGRHLLRPSRDTEQHQTETKEDNDPALLHKTVHMNLSLYCQQQRSVRLVANEFVQCVVERKLPRQALLVTYPGSRETLGDGPQSKAFG